MKSKILCLLIALVASVQIAEAQMSDNQIRNYARRRMQAGADAQTIGQELLERGVSQEQLSRTYAAYQSAGAAQAPATDEAGSRDRVNNGERRDANTPNTPATGIKIWGHDIFRSQNLSFEPNMSIATAPTYVVGPGDELIVDVYGASQKTTKAKVAPDGTINIPRIGPIPVSGMTVEQAQDRVRATMGHHYKNSTIKLSVGQTRTISINIMGEVQTPGTYTLSAFATVFHALYMAGGINELGTLRDIKVARNGRIISTVDVYEYILNGRLAGNVELRDNDVIIVGSYTNLVEVTGNVKRPMWYEMKKNESITSLLQFCGGFTGDAFKKHVTVNRRAGERLSVFTVDEFDLSSFTLADGDRVMIGGNENRYNNMVRIGGAVKRSGMYELTSVKTVRGLIETAGGLDENALTNRGVLIRMTENRTRQTITVDIAGIMNGTVADMPLENEDELQIASQAPIVESRTMTIDGEVYSPGSYHYSANTTIEDLITMAGGLRESATLLNVEVARRIVDQNASEDIEAKSETFNFKLDEGLRIGNGNAFVLQPYDHVYIRRSPVYEAQQSVTVDGEITFAGKYTLETNQVRISDIINKAGGLKKYASARNARLIRTMDVTEHERLAKLRELAVNSADSLDINDFVDTGSYSVGIELDKALAHPGSTYDIVLRNGDEIFIPKINSTVRISGEVFYPNSVPYIEGKSVSHYINQAGGFTKKSRKKHAYIVYANGRVCKASKGKVEPGCEIVIPTKEKKLFNGDDGFKWISLGLSIITSAAMVLTVVKK